MSRNKYILTKSEYTNNELMEHELFIKDKLSVKEIVSEAKKILDNNKTGVIITALDLFISKVINSSYILRKLEPALHQINYVISRNIEDTYIPLEKGLDIVVHKHPITCFSVKLLYRVT